MDISNFDYRLPKDLIANSPANPRDHSRLLVVDRNNTTITDHMFYNIVDLLGPNDVLVLNKTKVFPARFIGKKDTAGKIEVLLVEEIQNRVWKALTKPGLKVDQTIYFKGLAFKAIGHDDQTVLLETSLDRKSVLDLLQKYGKTPLPPYIHSKNNENSLRTSYQTVYADKTGSVAAPTAGLHFTVSLLRKLKTLGVQIEYVTLHVGIGTFAPVKVKKLEDHKMHSEYFEVEKEVIKRLNKAKKDGKRIIAVGTTSTRVLETLSNSLGQLDQLEIKKLTNIFIYPPYKFKFVDGLITNFHLPKSTLLSLVSAFVTFPNTKEKFESFEKTLIGMAYNQAIKNKYRFYSFGDACFII